jgi:ComF family protein
MRLIKQLLFLYSEQIITLSITLHNKDWCDLQHILYNMNILDKALGLIAPHACLGCNTEGLVLCQECAEQKLPFFKTGICYLCGKLSTNFMTCQKCSTSTTPQHVWLAAEYKDVAKQLVAAYKFEYARSAAITMAQYMDEALPYFAEAPVLAFVPTVPGHIRERGFDHAALLAKELCSLRGWHYIPVLARQTSRQQHGATKVARQAQVKNAFRVRNANLVMGKHVLLLDDVVTTGSTLSECSKVLKKAGAAQVDAAAFARTPEK